MTALLTTPTDSTVAPTRHRAAEQRGARIARPLRLLGRVRHVDEDLMAALGQGYLRTDGPGARVAAGFGASGPDRVTHVDVRRALRGDLDGVAAPLRELVEQLSVDPEWLDRDLLEEGARVYRTFGRTSGDVLLQLSLIGGYRFGGPADLLVATGGLTGESAVRRLAETQHWTVAVTEPGALLPGADGWRLTVHVRLMHALVNRRFSTGDRWDAARWGAPVNQSDQAATLALFSGTMLIGARALGVPVSRADSRAVMHLWRYIGWLLGIDEQWLFDTEREQHRFAYHVLRSQDGLTSAGRDLTQSIVDAQTQLHHRWPAGLRGWYAQRRLLSMLRLFLGSGSMRELGLPLRLPWATLLAVVSNVLRFRVLARTAWGRGWVERSADRFRREQLRRYFGDAVPDVAAL